MKEAIQHIRIGIGSLALALSIIAIIWSCNIGWFDNLCLGDVVLNYIGIPCWSNGTSGTHYTFAASTGTFTIVKDALVGSTYVGGKYVLTFGDTQVEIPIVAAQ